MKRSSLLLVLLFAAGLAAAETALTLRPTELQSQAQSDAQTLATLPANTKVEVLARKGAWNQVKAGAQSGWVRMAALKLEGAGGAQPAAGGGNGMGAIAGLLSNGRTSNSGTVTTGVRGLSEEDLRNAQANPAELQRMQQFAVGRQPAQAFAQRSKLAAQQVDYLLEPARNAQQGGN